MANTKIHINIDKSHVDWFNETFPGSSISWWLNLLIEKSREVMTVKPEDYAKLAAEKLKEDLGR